MKGAEPRKSSAGKTADVQQTAAQMPRAYLETLESIKCHIRTAQVKASLAANRELIVLYWQIGREILERQKIEGWGAQVVERLATDLHAAFPDLRGFSPRNLKYMRALAEAYPEGAIVQQSVAQIPWGHNTVLLDKLASRDERLWYARQVVQQGWSRAVLVHQIEADLYARHGSALNNFAHTLPSPQSDLARELLKDPYALDFLSLGPEISERELESKILERLRDFLLELGTGFAFLGSQYHLEVGGQDYYLDLLFYHTRLHCHVVVDLKVEEFKPEFAGKMAFYLAAVDDFLAQPPDGPSVGVILCKERNRVVVEYALRDSRSPMGVATYRLLPESLKAELPSPAKLKAQLKGADADGAGPIESGGITL